MTALTERQQAVLTFINEHVAAKGYAPTLREIGAHMGIRSTNGVSDYLDALERKGYLKRDDMKARGIVLSSQPTNGNVPPRWQPSMALALREVLSEYNIIATRGGHLVTDLAGEIVRGLERRAVPT